MSDDISIKLYQAISDANEPRVFESWHASNIADCPRAHYMKRLGVKPVSIPSAAKMLRWQAGHLIEEVIRPHLKTLYPNLISNKRVTSKEWDLTGEYDNYDPDSKTLIEIKSVGPRAVKYRKKEDTRYHLRDEQPYPAHVLQNHAYALLIEDMISSEDKVEQITFIYITLEGLIVPYTVPVSEDNLNHVKDRLNLLNASWSVKEPPICICQPDQPLYKSLHQFCDYKQEDNCCDIKLTKGVEGE